MSRKLSILRAGTDADSASCQFTGVLCDFDNALFAWDDLTDEGGLRKDGSGTKKAADIIMNSLHYPFTYETEFKCGVCTAQGFHILLQGKESLAILMLQFTEQADCLEMRKGGGGEIVGNRIGGLGIQLIE